MRQSDISDKIASDCDDGQIAGVAERISLTVVFKVKLSVMRASKHGPLNILVQAAPLWETGSPSGGALLVIRVIWMNINHFLLAQFLAPEKIDNLFSSPIKRQIRPDIKGRGNLSATLQLSLPLPKLGLALEWGSSMGTLGKVLFAIIARLLSDALVEGGGQPADDSQYYEESDVLHVVVMVSRCSGALTCVLFAHLYIADK